ncbi:hypothetical protein CCHR01_04537 [Colletotrichum chrysophilum]|uniref:Uncharacterized protein n=1 Tax=Colletotrichum chrysophilum TaxID=1836956 RepID=A0AAD9EQD3_9PEZI|nr:hypothetical protein CCHR01_04537 [Colletotrichum chrysophilum]
MTTNLRHIDSTAFSSKLEGTKLTAQVVHPVHPCPPHCPYLATVHDGGLPVPGEVPAPPPPVTGIAVPIGPLLASQVEAHPLPQPEPAAFVVPIEATEPPGTTYPDSLL